MKALTTILGGIGVGVGVGVGADGAHRAQRSTLG